MRLLAPFIVIIAALCVTVYLDDTPADADLVFINRGDVFTLDPQRQSYVQDFRMTYALYEGLVRWNNHDFSIEPAAASHWTVSDDSLQYTFHIRPDARWSDGAPVTAHDFVYSWMRLLLPETAADYSNLIFCIEGAEAFWRWRNDQVKAFVADPWSADEKDMAKSTLALVRRLRTLLPASDLPPGIALQGISDPAGLRRELEMLEQVATPVDEDVPVDPQSIALALETAGQVHDLHGRLHDDASRDAESTWMWELTQRRFAETVGIVALDDRTLRVQLAQPTHYFLDLVCFGVCYPVYRPCVEGWDDIDAATWETIRRDGWQAVTPPGWESCRWVTLNPFTGRFEQQHQWARPQELVGNGPYTLQEWRYKRDLRLAENPQYHSPHIVKSKSVVALTIEDTNTRVLAYESGKLDWLSEVGAEYEADMLAERQAYIDRYASVISASDPDFDRNGIPQDSTMATLPEPGSDERRNIRVLPTFGTDFYSFNCRPKLSDGRDNPFAIAAVRRAFVQAVDKRAIVTKVTRLNEPVATTLIPKGSIYGYNNPEGLGYNPEKAREELAAAGWKDTNGDGLIENGKTTFPVIDLLWTTNTPRYKWISLELKAQWERELGVRIELRGADTKFYKEDLKQGKFMIARGRWYGDYGDPTTFLDLCRTGDGNNDRGYSNERVDKYLRDAASEIDAAKRMRTLEECEAFLFNEEVPMLVICQLVQVYMYDPSRLKGLSTHPRLTQYVWQMEVVDP